MVDLEIYLCNCGTRIQRSKYRAICKGKNFTKHLQGQCNSCCNPISSRFKSHQNRKLQQSQRRWWRLWAQSWASISSLSGNFLALLLQLRNSPIAPSIVAELIVVCSFSVGVQACSGLTPGCTLNKVSHIFQVIIYWLSSLFAFIAALVPHQSCLHGPLRGTELSSTLLTLTMTNSHWHWQSQIKRTMKVRDIESGGRQHLQV